MDNRLFVYGAGPDALSAAAEAALLVAECIDSLEFDEARALAALADRSVCAGDLAERLTVEAGIDYRRAHGAVGRLVAELEAQGRFLADSTADEMLAASKVSGVELDAAQAKGILASALDLNGCVGARTDIGCAAPDEVAAMARELSATAGERREQIAQRRAHRKAAIDALLIEARAFFAEAA
jgi:argininosuccinate lyase